MSRLQKEYKTKIAPKLKADLGMGNDLATPKLQKIVINAGIGKMLQQQPKALDPVMDVLKTISGQKPVATRAKKAISSFKIREGQVVGASVTLRGKRAYDFFDKVVNVALPRTRDFRGLSSKGFDGHGNYSFAIKEIAVFPELAQVEDLTNFGVEVTVVTTAQTDEQGEKLLKSFGFPFKQEDSQ